MAVSASEWFILLSEGDAAQVRGKYGQFHSLEPRMLDDGRYILGMQVLEEPAFSSQIPFLATRTLCRLVEIEGVLKVRNNSEKPGDPLVLERTYLPRDKQNPLAPPPLPEKGDWSEASLYESVGRALSRWEAFETELANLFSALLGPSLDSTPAHRAYGSIIAFDGRLNMVIAAAEAYFAHYPRAYAKRGKVLEDSFNDIAGKARTLSSHRNRIAHGMVGEYTSPAGHVRGVALVPAHYARRGRKLMTVPRGSTKPEFAYTSGEVQYFAEQFWALRLPTSRLGGHDLSVSGTLRLSSRTVRLLYQAYNRTIVIYYY